MSDDFPYEVDPDASTHRLGVSFLDMYPNTPFAEAVAKSIREEGFTGEGSAVVHFAGVDFSVSVTPLNPE